MTEISSKVEKYFSQFPSHAYTKGKILIHASDNPEQVFFLVSGEVRQYDISYRGDEVVVNVFKSGAFFPLLGAMTGIPNKYFYDVEEDAVVKIAPNQEVIVFLKDNPDVLFDLLRRVYIGADGLLGRMVHLMSGSAQSRLLYELVIECRRFGKPDKDGSIRIALNETELASRAGLTRETVNREIRKINHEDLLKVSHRGILVKSLEQLEQRLVNTL